MACIPPETMFVPVEVLTNTSLPIIHQKPERQKKNQIRGSSLLGSNPEDGSCPIEIRLQKPQYENSNGVHETMKQQLRVINPPIGSGWEGKRK